MTSLLISPKFIHFTYNYSATSWDCCEELSEIIYAEHLVSIASSTFWAFLWDGHFFVRWAFFFFLWERYLSLLISVSYWLSYLKFTYCQSFSRDCSIWRNAESDKVMQPHFSKGKSSNGPEINILTMAEFLIWNVVRIF